jgi:Zn-dependent metalloprotease
MKEKFFIIILLSFLILNGITFAENYKINIVDYPEEIIVESGWMSYFNVVVMNIGDLNLNNVSIYFAGEFPQWFESQIKEKDVLGPKSNVSFLVKMSVPFIQETKTYSFVLNAKSKETTESKNFIIRIFKTKTDMMLYQVQKLEDEIENIEINATDVERSGKDITKVAEVLSEARELLDSSKNYINAGDYEAANRIMKNVENLIIEANFDLSISPPKTTPTATKEFSFETIIIIAMISTPISLIAIFYYVLRKRKEPPKRIDKIKEVIAEGKGPRNLENEVKDIESSKNLLEEEFKENLISKESYEELRGKYERRIIELRAEAERSRKI